MMCILTTASNADNGALNRVCSSLIPLAGTKAKRI